ncbi:MAG: hypothetical protein OES84_01175 [Kiritimatiellaceae bacterium]|nr:hypothetical protein [Kiritimatiellaceae bacterium]
MKVLARVFVVMSVAGLFSGCASKTAYIPSIPPKAQATILEYNELPENKVFIIAVNPNGEYAYGMASGKSSLKEAAKEALEQCEAGIVAYGIGVKPYVYAINNKVVYKQMIEKAFKAGEGKGREAQKKEILKKDAPASE